MTFDYVPILYESRKTSGHTQEELHTMLNHYGKRGFRLLHVIKHNEVQWTMIFERETRAEDPAAG